MRTEQLLLPGAVVAGCGLIGLGLYFGLRASAPAAPVASAPVHVTAAAHAPAPDTAPLASSASPIGVAPSPSAASSPEALQRARDAAKAALLAEKKATFLARCWEPALKREPTPATSKYVFDLAFDPEGREVARGISELRGESRPDVGQCLREVPMGLRLTPPPGANLDVSVEISFP